MAKEKVKTEKKAKPRKKKNTDAQFEKIAIKAGDAPDHALIFTDKECWKVLPKNEGAEAFVRGWRLKQDGTDEIREIPKDQEVKIQKLYLEN